jgi:outer membrane biosynthesis protein TonB
VNYIRAEHEFNARKNRKAGLYTLLICGSLLLMLFLISWDLPFNPPAPVEEGLEVNLGNSDQGSGSNQPFLPNQPSKQDQAKYTPPKTVAATKEALKDVETDDKDPDPAPAVKHPPVTKPNATKIPDKDLAVKTPRKTIQPAVNPTPVPPKPKAVFHGVNGDGSGGNDADHFKPGGNQGIAGGKGDQGKPGGDPNSTNYNGGGHGNGIAIARGLQGRRISSTPSFTDEFNENAKVAVDIRVDAAGNVTSAEYQAKGSTTADATLKAIAIRKAHQVKFNNGSDESAGTIVFNFKLKN